MTETKARHLSLTMIASEVIIVFGVFAVMLINVRSEMTVQENGIDIPALVVLGCFFIIGVAIILSSFSRILFYIFSAIEAALVSYLFLAFLFIGFSLDHTTLLMTLICLALLAPLIFYYSLAIKRSIRQQ